MSLAVEIAFPDCVQVLDELVIPEATLCLPSSFKYDLRLFSGLCVVFLCLLIYIAHVWCLRIFHDFYL
jgi:hypothetical protein